MKKIEAQLKKRIKKRYAKLKILKQNDKFMLAWSEQCTYVWGRSGRRRNRKRAFALTWGFDGI